MQVKEVVEKTARFFASKGIESARLDSDLLLASALGWERLQLYLNFDYPLSEAQLALCRELVRRRAQGEPVAYILGRKDFYKSTFVVKPGVLIPRPETEQMVERALAWIQSQSIETPQIVDLGTGSGCIGLSLLGELPLARLLAVDKSSAALDVAKENAQRLNLLERVEFVQGDAGVLVQRSMADIVVANPPYISEDDESVMPAVRQYEPAEALFSPDKGLAHIADWSRTAAQLLKSGGFAIFEIGSQQGSAARDLFAGCQGLADIQVWKDLAGHERFIEAIKK